MSLSISSSKSLAQSPDICKCTHSLDKMINLYKSHLMYHGTDKKYARKILKNGMKIKLKEQGCDSLLSQAFGLRDDSASKYHYLMGKKSAARYAKMHKEPVILRVIIPKTLKLEKDPQRYEEDERRTKENIKSACILPMNADDLSKKQIKKINKLVCKESFFCHHHLKKLKKLIQKEILLDTQDDQKILAEVKDFMSMEKTRNAFTMKKLKDSGINLADLKEGQEYTISLD